MHTTDTTTTTSRQGQDWVPYIARAVGVPHLLRRLLQAVTVATSRHGAVAQAHSRRCSLEQLSPDIQSDIGQTREDAIGIASMQDELPFFMQTGFGRSNR